MEVNQLIFFLSISIGTNEVAFNMLDRFMEAATKL